MTGAIYTPEELMEKVHQQRKELDKAVGMWTIAEAENIVLRERIAEFEAAIPGWISVEDELPKKDDEYLVRLSDSFGSWHDVGNWVDGGWDNLRDKTPYVTHWMPLPGTQRSQPTTNTWKQFVLDPFHDTKLSPDAKEIGRLAVKGLGQAEIAEEIGKHKTSVIHHLRSVHAAVGTKKVTELSQWAWSKLESMARSKYVVHAVVDERTCTCCLARDGLVFEEMPGEVCTKDVVEDGGCRCVVEEVPGEMEESE